MKQSVRILMLGGLCCSMFLTACAKEQGPMERAGERTDEIMDNVREGENPLKKRGALERAGESIDESLGTNRR